MTESTRESGDVDLDLPGLGLLVREPYISFILAHQKRWEIRGTRTKHRGRLALIRSKSGLIVGECKIIDCKGPLEFQELVSASELSYEEREELRKEGKLPYLQGDGATSKTYAWVLDRPQIYRTAIPYKHPPGAIVFVDLKKPGVLG